jgi:hypothetical protein
VAILLAIGVLLPIVIGTIAGSLTVPRNDDPAYRRVALELYSNGRLSFNGWSEMTLIGQIVFVQPFLWLSGGSAWAFTASTSVLAAGGILCGYALARFVLSVPRATLAVLLVLVFPGYLLNTTSYMTDVPAWSTEIMCLWLGAVALSRSDSRRWIWLFASLAVGCFAFSIREFAAAAPAAVLGAHLATPLWRRRGLWLAAAAVMLICLAVYVLKGLLPGARVVSGPLLTRLLLSDLKDGIATLALMLLPVLIIAIGSLRRSWRTLDVLVGAAAGILMYRTPLMDLVRTHSMPQLVMGNLIDPYGAMGLVALPGSRPLLLADHSWGALNVAALAAGLIFFAVAGGTVGVVVRSARPFLNDARVRMTAWQGLGSVGGMALIFAALYGGGIFAWSFVFPAYDRYLWPLVTPISMLVLRPSAGAVEGESVANAESRPRPSRLAWAGPVGISVVAIALIASLSLGLLLNGDAFDAARWNAGDNAVAGGANPATLDAGFEWVTFYATGSAVRAAAPAIGGKYETRWPSFHLCALVANSPLNSPQLTLRTVDNGAYKLFLFAGPSESLYVYSVQGTGCP